MKKNAPILSDELLEKFYTACEEYGVKVTHQRLEIYREIASAKDHPSAEDIYKRVKKRTPMISLDTVYRTLALFERSRIITRVHPLDDHCRFDPNTETHHHFICLQCKKVEDFYWQGFDQLTPPAEAQQWGLIKSQLVELHGICSVCLKKKPGAEESCD